MNRKVVDCGHEAPIYDDGRWCIFCVKELWQRYTLAICALKEAKRWILQTSPWQDEANTARKIDEILALDASWQPHGIEEER